MNQPQWLRPEKAWKPLDLDSVDQLYRLLRENLLPPTIRVLKIGRQYRLNAADLGVATATAEQAAQSAEASANAA